MAEPNLPRDEVRQRVRNANDPGDGVVQTPMEARQGRGGVRILIILGVSLFLAVMAGFLIGWFRP